ncbi:ABC transporter substrate-binding protein [Mahella australiensis]|uniref:Extracellular solute-binding protein family 1 n=1 Tax=Mahella australiensis (strain DSM 15567 / CIP 107919 / 50-1 BON) TaxID=697281 RepID=F4A2J3_MAHA5|nr:sugar ABC transporter substrate-binding protein [Mahella australiensis]AEE97259.1 extracellular solute-binding protein family 1 [Mahella australiensis 50-1 BON]
MTGKKLLIILLAILVMSLTIVGCSSTPPATLGDEGANQQEQEQGSNDSGGAEQPKEVTILTWDKPDDTALPWQKQHYDEVIKAFREKYPWIKVEDKSLAPGTDYRQKYDQALLSGEEPTVAGCFPYVDIPTRARDGSIGDMTELVENWDLKNQGKVFNGYEQALQVDGKWYAVPRGAYLQYIVVNKKLVQEAGLDPANIPTTWDEFGKFAGQLTDPSKNRFGFGLMGMEWCAWPFTNFVWNAGGEMGVPNDDGTWKLTFAEQPGVDAIMFWHDLIWKYKATQKNVLENYTDLIAEFTQGRVVMEWGGVGGFSSDYVTKYGGDINDLDIAAVPAKEGCTNYHLSGGETWTISPKATEEQKQAAWIYIQYMGYDVDKLKSDAQVQAANNAPILTPSPRTDFNYLDYATNIPESWKQKIPEFSKTAKAEPWFPHWNDVKNALVKPIQQIILDKDITAQKAQQILQKCQDDLYSKYPDTFKK